MIVARVALFSLSLLLLIPLLSMGSPLPKAIGSLPLTQTKSGEEARQEIDRLHGKQLNYRKGYIGIYGEGDDKATLWVSEYGSEGDAVEAIEKMAQSMKKKEQKVFWHFMEMPMDGVMVYFVMGMGQAHYFFQKGAKAIWLAVDPSQGKPAIRDVIGKIN
jgi:hypothetical protein